MRFIPLAAAALTFTAAQAQDMIGVTWSGDVVTVDSQAGTLTVVGSTGFDRLNSHALAGDGTPYTISNQVGNGLLVRIDPVTGAGTQVAALGPALADVRGLAWDDATGELLALSRVTPGSLYTIHPNTGAATLVAPIQINSPAYAGAAVTPNGRLYIWNSWGSTAQGGLFEVDRVTGATTQVVPHAGIYNWLTVDSNGVLWGGTSAAGDLNIIDPVAGTVTSGGSYTSSDVRGLDFLRGDVGTNYCGPAVPNSTGSPAEIEATGSAAVAVNALVLEATGLPSNAFGYFVTSMTRGNVQQPGGSMGVLCLGGAIGRYVGQGQILNSGASGAFSLAVDLTQHPTPTGLVQVNAGETWNFQAWFRDMTPGGAATSNFTDAVEVLFL